MKRETSWCPERGGEAGIDEDGCCAFCGRDKEHRAMEHEVRMIAADHGVPIPPRRGRHRGQPPKYPWRELEKVGDSFFVEGATRAGFTAGVSAAGKAHGMKFETREVLEHDAAGNLVPGVRVWRTE